MDPDTWAIISAVAAMMALNSALLTRMVRAQVGLVREELASHRRETELRFTAVDAQFAAVDAQFVAAREHVDERFRAATAHTDAQFAILRTQLTGVENDMLLVKAHLLGMTRAG